MEFIQTLSSRVNIKRDLQLEKKSLNAIKLFFVFLKSDFLKAISFERKMRSKRGFFRMPLLNYISG